MGKQKKYFIKQKVALKRYERSAVSKRKKRNKNRLESGWVDFRQASFDLKAPKYITLYKKHHKLFLIFLAHLRKEALSKKRRLRINFTETVSMSSAATLLLIAEIERIQILSKKKLISGNLPKNKIAAQVFCKTGLSTLLGISHRVEAEHESVTYWDKYLTGEDGTVVNAAKELNKIKLKPKYKRAFFTGISEAITNISMHAYESIDARADGFSFIDHKWWMFTGCDDEKITLVICDIGKGIPTALETRDDYSKLSEIIGLMSGGKHSKAIKAAMEVGKTSSGLSHRGKGMVQLKQAIDTMNAGNLHIHSNKGYYRYSSGGEEIFSKDLKYSIMGTIVSWSAPLDKLQKMIENEQQNDKY